MISSAASDNFEILKNGFGETGSAETVTADFAALFSLPVGFPPPNDSTPSASFAEEDIKSVSLQTLLGGQETPEINHQPDFLKNRPVNDVFRQSVEQIELDLELNASEAAAAEIQALIETGVETGKIEILEAPENTAISNSNQDAAVSFAFSPNEKKDDALNRLPKLFGEVSKFVASKNLEQNAAPDLSADAAVTAFSLPNKDSGAFQIVAEIEANAPVEASMNSNLPEALESEKKVSDGEEELPAIAFDKLAAFVLKEQKAAENLTVDSAKAEKVCDQVEAQVLFLANSVSRENEKKVMKMRLHPAELGAVEIRLERSASGDLSAFFQTETEAARQILTENIEQLSEALRNSGWQIEQMEITCGAFSPGESGGREDQAQREQLFEYEPKPDSDGSRAEKEDSKQNQSNRLVNLRA